MLDLMIVQPVQAKGSVTEKLTVININCSNMKEGKNKYQSRRDFVKTAGKLIVIRRLLSFLHFL